MKTIVAKFIGEDNSLGYKNGKTYTLKLYEPSFIAKVLKYGWKIDVIVMHSGHVNCPYTWAGFNKNWKKL